MQRFLKTACRATVLLAGASLILAAGNACAETLPAYGPEAEFAADNWNKPPIKIGSFLLFSGLEITEAYNDNIFAQEDNTEGDFITYVSPYAQIVKEIGRHKFGLMTAARGQYYLENDDENLIDYSAALSGDLEALQSLHIPLKLAFSKEHQARTNRRETSLTESPVEFTRTIAQTGFIYNPNRLKLEVLGGYEALRVDDSKNKLTGVVTDGSEKDKDTREVSATLSYETRTSWRPLLKLIYAKENYLKLSSGNNNLNRDNKTLRTLAGIAFDYKGLIGGNILLGRDRRSYDDSRIESASGFSSDTSITFAPTERLKGRFDFTRRTIDDNLLLSGLTETAYKLELEQELTARWSAGVTASMTETDFSTSDRKDDKYGLGASVVYNVKRGLALEGEYIFLTRDSNIDGLSYDNNVLMLRLKNQF